MTNKFIILLVSTLMCLNMNAQIKLVKDSLAHPTAITFLENKAFVSIQGHSTDEGQLISFELDNPSATCITHFDSLTNYPRSIASHNNIVYIGFTNYIGKVDLNLNPLEIEVLTSNVFFPRCLIVNNDTLYIAEDDKISYIDLLNQNTDPITVIDNLEFMPLSIDMKNEYLYFTGANNIYKNNPTDNTNEITNVISDLDYTVYSIKIVENELYLDQTYDSPSSKEIMKFNLDAPTNTLETVVSGIGSAIHINHYNDTLYFVSPLEPNDKLIGKIFKLTEQIGTSTKSLVNESVKIYPNPANEFLNVESLENKNLKASIYNLKGELMMNPIKTPQINISKLKTGIYFIDFSSNTTVVARKQFIKVN